MLFTNKNTNPIAEADRVKLLFQDNVPTLILGVVSGLVFYSVFNESFDSKILIMVITPYPVFSIMRHLLGVKFWKGLKNHKIKNYVSWENRFAFLTLCSGLSFGFSNYWIFTEGDLITQTFVVAMSFGYASGCLESFGSSVKTVVSFSAPTLFFLVFALITKGHASAYNGLALMGFLYFLHSVKSTFSINRMIKKEIEHKYSSIESSKMTALGEMARGMVSSFKRIWKHYSCELYFN